ncbi:MAG: hypothetical protein GXP45_06235 [bacterium]|nr:hypothetical protein [bacterium]
MKLFLTEAENKEMRSKYEKGGLSYKYAKDVLFEKLIDFLKPIQDKYAQISDQEIIDMLAKNAKTANEIAQKKIKEVYQKVGFSL